MERFLAGGLILQLREPGFFGFAKFLDLNPSFRSTQDSTDCQNDDIPQAMSLGALDPRVFYVRKKGIRSI